MLIQKGPLLASVFFATMILGVTTLRAAEERNLIANGSFEFWTPVNDEFVKDPRLGFAGGDPQAPIRWDFNLAVTHSADAHGGKVAASAKGHTRLGIRFVELNPGSTYSFGAWVKAKGKDTEKVVIGINGQAFEGLQKLSEIAGEAGAEWSEIRGEVKMPGHIRLTELYVQVAGNSEVLIDDAFLSAKFADSSSADDVLSKKYLKDAGTIFYEDFDGPKPAISFPTKNGKSAVTGAGGGRFGKGVQMFKSELATLPLSVENFPPEGTIEFWISPDDFQKSNFLEIQASDGNIATIGWLFNVSWDNKKTKNNGWLVNPYPHDKIRRRPGSWTHVAMTWDSSAIRLYLDGVLSILHTGKQPDWRPPAILNIGSGLDWFCWSGKMDEIRFSNVKRYGPFVPEGDKFTPFPDFTKTAVDEKEEAAPPAEEKVDPKAEAARIAQERGRLIVPLLSGAIGKFENSPNEKGDYIYEAESAKPLVSDSAIVWLKDKPAKGLTLAKISSSRPIHKDQPDVEGVYWKLGKIKSGKYWITLQRSEFNPAIFLNGRIVQCPRATDPIQAAPGLWISEAQSDQPLELKEGDEISVQCQCMHSSNPMIGALFLRSEMPEPGKHPLMTFMGGGADTLYTAHCIGAEATFLGVDGEMLPAMGNWFSPEQKTDLPASFEKGADGRPVVTVRISNPLPFPLQIDYSCEILSYYRRQVGVEKEVLTLQAHESVTRKVPFRLIPDETAYSAFVKLQAVDPPKTDWPEGDEISYFPGLRHSVAWPNPWRHWFLRRITFTQPIESQRQTLSLNGVWEKAFIKGIEAVYPIPAGLTFKTMTVPGGFHGGPPKDSKDQHGMYLRKMFTLPPEAAGRTYKIVVPYVVDEATVWVNGQKVGNRRGANTPLIADATKALKVGENEIVIVVRDLTVLMNPDYVNQADPQPSCFYLDVPGYFSASSPSIGSVDILTSPLIAVEDVQALPSFRNKTLIARYAVANRRDVPAKVKVRAQVLDGGKSVLLLDEREMILAPGKKEDLEVQKSWQNPQLWGPANPHLYVLAVEIFDPATGGRIDLARERFGFRECWIDGPDIVLNGISIRPKGGFDPRDEMPTLTRGTQGRVDWYDEMGRMGFEMTTMLTNSPSRHNLEREQYWESAKQNAVEHVKMWINHPSVVGWDISNEWLAYMGSYAPDPMLPGKRFKDVSDFVRAYDPTRWTLGNAEGDFMGLLDNHSYHYMDPTAWGDAAMGHTSYLPDGQFWRSLDRHFKPDEGILLSHVHPSTLRPDLKVIMNNEHLWKCGMSMAPGMTEVCGERDFLGYAIDSASPTASWYWKMRIDGNRDLGVSLIHHYTQPGVQTRADLPRTFIMPDVAHHGFSSKPFVRLYKVFNDEMTPATMEFKWELIDSEGKTVEGDSNKIKLEPGQKYNGRIQFTLPEVAKRSRFLLRTKLYGDEKFITGQELDVDVWPDQPPSIGALERKLYLYDPLGETTRVLEESLIKFEKIAELAAPKEVPEKTLIVVGEGALDEGNTSACFKLSDYVSAGGRIVFLAQKVTPAGLPAATKLSASQWSSICFNRMASHPILEGVTDWDLSFWANDRVVGRGAYSKPDRGAAITLIDSGYQDKGMEFVNLMEQFRGKGSYLLCQLPLIEKYSQEPMTREILARMIRYTANGKAYVEPVGNIQAMVSPHGTVRKSLDAIGVPYEIVKTDAPFKTDSPILAEASILRSETDQKRDTLAGALANGATVVISAPLPQDAEWLSKLAGTPVAITVQPYSNWHGRGMRIGYSPFTAGLSHQDLYWKRLDGGETSKSQWDDPQYTIEAFQDASASAKGARELIFPGALLKLNVGKGTLLIDERRWMTANGELAKLAGRNLSALLIGLGAAIEPVVEVRQLPKELDYRTIDLTQFNNRSLRDDKAGDGEGGWSDQGAGADLKSFPTGKLNFQGIPFFVGNDPRSCLVLRNENRSYPEKYPTEVTIPVGYPVEGFHFLQGFAETSDKPISVFQMIYDDGTTYDVKVIGDVNANDWAAGPGNSFPHEKDTSSSVAWTGSSDMISVATIYKMRWINPRPEVAIKAIRYFKTPEMIGVHTLMGLTSFLKREMKQPSADELAKIADLMKRGAEAAKNKDNDTAETLFRQVINLDPRKWDAYQQLADVLEQSKDEAALLDHYQAWVRNGALVPGPYNRIAEIAEKRKDLRGALEYYTRSLQVEWNQPPVIEAKRRLENEIAKQSGEAR